MTDDIVTRLRMVETIGEPSMPWHVTPKEAADEIEHLRYEVARWKQLAKQEIVMCDANDPCEMCKELAVD